MATGPVTNIVWMELPDISLSQSDLVTAAATSMTKLLDKSFLVTPSQLLTHHKGDPLPASSLTFGDEGNAGVHFYHQNFKSTLGTEYESFKSIVSSNLEKATRYLHKYVYSDIAKCGSRILRKFTTTSRIRNEAELRYAIGDPLIELLCNLFGLRVRLEERVSENLDTTGNTALPLSLHHTHTLAPQDRSPGRRVAESVGEQSHADYTCWTLRSCPAEEEVVAVLIMTTHCKYAHAIAQVLGYYIAFNTTNIPPLVFVLSEKSIQLLLLPFKQHSGDKDLLANAVLLPKMPVWEAEGTKTLSSVDHKTLMTLVLLLQLLLGSMGLEEQISFEYFASPKIKEVPKRNLRQLVQRPVDREKEYQQQLQQKDQMIKELKEQNEQMVKQIEQRRKRLQEQHEQMVKQTEQQRKRLQEQHEQMVKQTEQRKRLQEQTEQLIQQLQLSEGRSRKKRKNDD